MPIWLKVDVGLYNAAIKPVLMYMSDTLASRTAEQDALEITVTRIRGVDDGNEEAFEYHNQRNKSKCMC